MPATSPARRETEAGTIMTPDITCTGEMLVEIMRDAVGVPHMQVGGIYKGPYPSGAPAIFIDAAARAGAALGITSGFIGVVGNDDFGKVITGKLERDGVDISGVRIDPGNTTGVAFVQYNADGSRKFIFAPGAAGQLRPSDVDERYFAGAKAFHVMGSALSISDGSRRATMKAMRAAIAAGAIVSFDPNLRTEMMPLDQILDICQPVVQQATILLPSGEEATMLTGEMDPASACESLLAAGPSIVVLKQGKDGCTVFTKDETIPVSGFPVKEIDPTGAGDTFDGTFVVEHLAGASLGDAARVANAAGALKVQSFGPMASSTRDEILALPATGR